jgi:enterochelin esterase-like enzyme
MTHIRLIALSSFLLGLSACAVSQPASTPTASPLPSATSSVTPSPTVVPSATPLTCLSQPGQVISRAIQTEKPPQEFLIYLPPCYDQNTDQRYPVLYLLHGQTYMDDQWVKLGAPVAADNLIHSGEASPFIIVFPDDRYWNLPPGDSFGSRLIGDILPFVDQNYRTLADRSHRALGGLSRGGGWSVHFLLTRYDLFGTIGLHSPVIFNDDAAVLERLVAAVPSASWPRLWMDAGDADGDLGKIKAFETLLTVYQVPHEWRMYTGDHTDPYWHAHVTEYLQWYVEGFKVGDSPAADATPTP